MKLGWSQLVQLSIADAVMIPNFTTETLQLYSLLEVMVINSGFSQAAFQ